MPNGPEMDDTRFFAENHEFRQLEHGKQQPGQDEHLLGGADCAGG